ncbi:MAG: bifunctional UDP-N-acetylglucosamine diphosphorylase/glucosamine-1-phosphate N-acetyltransferase GlmU [Elusimicrobiales bacterium]
MKSDKAALILAAGLGTRMKSDIPKVLHLFDGIPLVFHIIRKIINLGIKDVIVVVGYKGEMVKDYIEKEFSNSQLDLSFVHQRLLKGSGRAVYDASQEIKKFNSVLVISGDVPLVEEKTLKSMIRIFETGNFDAVVLSCEVKEPKNYGRIIRNFDGRVISITEADELSDSQKDINEINAGIYIFKTASLLDAVSRLRPKGKKKEYYLTDAIENIYKSGGKVDAFKINDEIEVSGANSKSELIELEKRYYLRNARKLADSGVIIKDFSSVYISAGVRIQKDTVIYNNVHIKGSSKLGKNVIIGPYVIIEDSIIEDDCVIKPFCYISKSRIRSSSSVGPYSHIRPESDIGPFAKIGNFSEIKKSRIGEGSKVPHLSYIGDTDMGKRVNIGAGTITCNYDGVKKHKTIIKDRAFIGSNTNLVAPVVIGSDVLIGAGSTITEDVADGKLAIARARQVIKERKRIE